MDFSFVKLKETVEPSPLFIKSFKWLYSMYTFEYACIIFGPVFLREIPK